MHIRSIIQTHCYESKTWIFVCFGHFECYYVEYLTRTGTARYQACDPLKIKIINYDGLIIEKIII